jgi:hypothetical protein
VIFAPTIIAALFEKRIVWPYGPIRKDEAEIERLSSSDDREISNYIIRFINDAAQEGFEYLGYCNDIKGSKYKIVYHFLVSPDKYTLAIIGGGKILWMRVWGTWLFSKFYDETCYYSVDNQSGIETDMSKLWHDQLIFCKDFATLYKKHQNWIKENTSALKTYSRGNELNEHHTARIYRVDYMERLGYIKYLDSNKEYWKYTLRGAIKLSLYGIIVGLFRHIKAGKIHAR